MKFTLPMLYQKGSCRGSEDPRLWDFDDDSIHTIPADIQIMCDRCPVQGMCLDWAMENEEDNGESGIWGGTGPYQRRQLKREMGRAKCPGCGSTGIAPTARGELCISCGISWRV